ncbi:MAG: DMT family transporter [Candidatus Micrarchaeia archaeon]
MTSSMKLKGYAAISIAVVELSFLPIFSSMGAGLGTLMLLFLIFATSTLVSFAVVAHKHKLGELYAILRNRKAIPRVFSAGLLNYALPQLLLVIGVAGTNPVVGSLVIKLWPLFLAMMLPFALKTSVKWQQVAALFLGLAAVYILVAHGSAYVNWQELPFILVLVGYALSTAFSNVIIKGYNYDIFSQVFLFNAFSLVFVAGAMLALHTPFITSISAPELVSFLFLGAVSYSLGAILFFYTLKLLNPMIASSATFATPALTALFSLILLGTRFYAYYVVSFAMLVAAFAMQQRYGSGAPEYQKQKHRLQLFDVTGAFISTENSIIASSIFGGGRALAVKVEKGRLGALADGLKPADAYKCIVFKSSASGIGKETTAFINDIMGKQEHEDVLIGVGNADNVEKFFDSISEKLSANEKAMPLHE